MRHRTTAALLSVAFVIGGAALGAGCSSDDAPRPTPATTASSATTGPGGATATTAADPTAADPTAADPTAADPTAVVPDVPGSAAGADGSTPRVLVINGPAQVDLTTAP